MASSESDNTTPAWIGAAARIEAGIERLWAPLRRRLALDQPRQVAAYRGFGTPESISVMGRVLGNRLRGGPGEQDTTFDNLRHTIARWNSREIPDQRVVLSHGAQTLEVVTDEEGYYRAQFRPATAAPRRACRWLGVDVRSEGRRGAATARHDVLLPGSGAEYLVVSDLDDTVIETGITNLLTAARLTFLGNARTRKPLAGVGEFYRALQGPDPDAPTNPLFYVSSSPWNLYDLLRDFLALNEIPAGPILLRDLGVDETRFIKKKGHAHKLDNLLRLLETYPALPAVLIGDSGQEDAHLYTQALRVYPQRILAIYIRDVDPGIATARDDGVEAARELAAQYDVDLLRGASTTEFADHAAALGLIAPDSRVDIAAAVEADRARPRLAEAQDV